MPSRRRPASVRFLQRAPSGPRPFACALILLCACGSPRENLQVDAVFGNMMLVSRATMPWSTTLSFVAHYMNGRAGVAPDTTITVNRVDVFRVAMPNDVFLATILPTASPAWNGMLASGATADVNYSGSAPLMVDPTTNVCGQMVRFVMTLTTTTTTGPIALTSDAFIAATCP